MSGGKKGVNGGKRGVSGNFGSSKKSKMTAELQLFSKIFEIGWRHERKKMSNVERRMSNVKV